MPNSIPYHHPSLALGNIVDPQVLKLLDDINVAQSSIESAQDTMNSLITMKRSLEMTVSELADMKIDTTSIKEKIQSLDKQLTDAINAYIKSRMDGETSIQKTRQSLSALKLSHVPESPLDFSQSQLTYEPFGAESLKLDAQYFNSDNADSLSNIKSSVKETAKDLGSQNAEDLSNTAVSKTQAQQQKHEVQGTLIITASCTHRNVAFFKNCVLDPEKTVAAWNHFYKNDAIDASSPIQLEALIKASSAKGKTSGENAIHVLSGAAYGSSFIGMVHILKSQTGEQSIDLSGKALERLDKKIEIGQWLASKTGSITIDSSILKEIKQTIDAHQIKAHITLLSMGVVPTIKSNDMDKGVRAMLSPFKETSSSGDDNNTAEINKTMALKNAQANAAIEGLHKVDVENNKVMNINTLMTAFENYVESVRGTDKSNATGMPVHFQLKRIDKLAVLELMKEKFPKLGEKTGVDKTSTK